MRPVEPVTRRSITRRDPLKKERKKKKKRKKKIDIRRIDLMRDDDRRKLDHAAGYHSLNLPRVRTYREKYRNISRTGWAEVRKKFLQQYRSRARDAPLSLGYRGFVRSCRLHRVRDTLTYWVTCRNWATHPCGHVWPIFVVRFAAELVSIDSGSLRRWVRFDAARAADNNIRDRKSAGWRTQTHVASSDALGKRKERLANDHHGRMIHGEKERAERAAN